MDKKRIYKLLEMSLSYARSNLDDFNEVLEEDFTEQDIEDALYLVKDET